MNKPTNFPFSPPKSEKSCLVFPVAAKAAVSSVTTERCRRKTQKHDHKSRNDENVHVCSNTDPISFEQLGPSQFTFVRPNGTVCRFNVASLVEYITKTGHFCDPESRLEFSDDDLRQIDWIAKEGGLNLESVYDARRLQTKRYQDQAFVEDALSGLERCAGEQVTEMLEIVENTKLTPESSQLALLTKVLPPFNDLMHQIRAEDPEFAWQTASHFKMLLQGPPNRPTKDRSGLLKMCVNIIDRHVQSAKLAQGKTEAKQKAQQAQSRVTSVSLRC